MSEVNQRLQRLVDSDICQAENFEAYKEELNQLSQEAINNETVKEHKDFFKALASENRLKIVKLLKIREMCVCELMIALNMSQPNLSHHMRLLENARIIDCKKKGKWVYCSLSKKENIKNMIKINLL